MTNYPFRSLPRPAWLRGIGPASARLRYLAQTTIPVIFTHT